jgi:hypothetical protein
MDPHWNDIKRVLKHHFEISHGQLCAPINFD